MVAFELELIRLLNPTLGRLGFWVEVDSIDLAFGTFPFSVSVSWVPGRELDVAITAIAWDGFGDSLEIKVEFGTNECSVNDGSDVACFLAVSLRLFVILPRPSLYICDWIES